MALSNSSTLRVILDTNILIYSAAEPFDIAYMLRQRGIFFIKVPSFVINELEALCGGSGVKGVRFAKLALQIARQFEVINTKIGGRDVDDKIFNLALREGYAVATADVSLRRRILEAGACVVYLKDRQLIVNNMPS